MLCTKFILFKYFWTYLIFGKHGNLETVTRGFTVQHFPPVLLCVQHHPEFTYILEDPAASRL